MGEAFTINAFVDGLGRTERQLRACAVYLPFELRKGTVETVRLVERVAIERSPVKSGETRRRIHGEVLSGTEGIVGTDQEAAMAIDQGAKPHVIKPRTTKALAIPQQDEKGRYTSITRTRRRKLRGGGEQVTAGKFKKVQYRDVENAPNKRHLDVLFFFTKRVNHPGKKPQHFLSTAATYAQVIAPQQARKAVARAIKRAEGRT